MARERLEERVTFTTTPSMLKEIDAAIAESGEDVSKFVRRAIEETLNPSRIAIAHDPFLDTFRAPILTKAPAGPWEEAIQHASVFTVSQDTADELALRSGDVFVRTNGDSMEGAGIPDGCLLAARPLVNGRVPRDGSIALVQALTADGYALGTIKRWTGSDPVVLLDGQDEPFDLPPETERLQAVAVIVAMLTQV